ncbi:MAG: UDP-N-acetylmuramoyl-L-alanine--D-glutamate ligase, partial [bacterium]
MKIKNKKILIVGLARTGVACAKLLHKLGAHVTITDKADQTTLQDKIDQLKEIEGINYELGEHKIDTFLKSDLILLSPGVPLTISPLQKAKNKDIPIISEIELIFQLTQIPIIGITGTNGKTTTTTLIGEIFKAADKKVFVGGNIGNPLSYALINEERRTRNEEPVTNYDYLIAEISSFQLETIKQFSPYISIILNITPDHLDRYKDIEEYIEVKARILKNQGENDFVVLNADDPLTCNLSKYTNTKVFYFSTRTIVKQGVFVADNEIIFCYKDQEEALIKLNEVRLKGLHNLENILAAVCAAMICRLPVNKIKQVLSTFKALEHRLEEIRVINNIRFINDSKGTNIGAVIKSLQSFQQPIILIAG